MLNGYPDEVYAGEVYTGSTRRHQKAGIRPSGGGALISAAWATVRLPCRRGGYDTVTFQLPSESQKLISGSGQFQAAARYGANRSAYGYSFSINGQFSSAYSVTGTLSAIEQDRKYGRCASGPVRYTAHT